MLGVWRDGNAVMTEDGSLFDEVQPAPTGTVTFLFTDIEGSTRLLQALGRRYGELQAAHQGAIRAACRAWGGYEVDTQGDSFLWAFQSAADAVQAAVAVQRKIDDLRLMIDDSAPNHQSSIFNPQSSVINPQSSVISLRVRMSLHTGEPTLVNGRYIGLDLNRGARICAAAHGGQVLLSPTTRDLVEGALPQGVTLRDMGEHRLKDLRRARRLYQLVIPGRDNDFPPLRTLTAHRNNLPVQATTLVDREAECGALRALLLRDAVRLVTLTGPGGVGKTRLALHVAAEMFDAFPDGVFFVPLASVTDPELVLSAIAQALDLQEAGGKSLLEGLRAWLKERQVLLVLDNFEQVTHAGRLISQLLQAAPRVKAVVTSRAVLRVYGEQEFGVQTLPVPTEEGLGNRDYGIGNTDYATRNTQYAIRNTQYELRITEYPSVQLFVQRAQMVRPDFRVTPDNAAAVAAICARLDGLPLAIELAAARVKLLSPPAMLQRLDRRLALLTSGSRDLPLRQQTLRASIDWSYDLLDEGERAVFRRLAVFVGGFTLEAAEEVCGASSVEGGEEARDTEALHALPSALDALEKLVNESLVQQREDAAGETRFALLETIREYALERLEESGEADILRRRHADYFARLAEQANAELRGPDQPLWLNRLEKDDDNIRATLRWLKQGAAGEELLKLAGAMWLYWYLRGHWTEGRMWLTDALQGVPAEQSTAPVWAPLRTKALNAIGALATAQGDYQGARARYEECLAIQRTLNDKFRIAIILIHLGSVASAQGDYHTAQKPLEESIALLRDGGDKATLAACLNNLGLVMHEQGDLARARALYEECLGLQEELGDRWIIARVLNNLGEVASDQGEYEVARSFLERSLAVSQEIGDKWPLADALTNLGRLLYITGDLAHSRRRLEESLVVWREVGHKQGGASSLKWLGRVARAEGDAATARRLFAESQALYRESGDTRGAAEAEGELAALPAG